VQLEYTDGKMGGNLFYSSKNCMRQNRLRCFRFWNLNRVYLNFGFSKKRQKFSRGEWGYMKCKIIWGKMKHSCYISLKTCLKFVLFKIKIDVSFCPLFHAAPFSPNYIYYYMNFMCLITGFVFFKSH
jgi:hypothetical protein